MVNLYSDMWKHRSHLQAPLTPLTKLKRNAKSTWLSIKEVMAQDVLLAYPDFNLPFDIHTDASDFQLGAVISQNGKPIALYSHRLSISQRNYMTTERELLSIHKTLRKYRNILLGHKINVFTDHQNLLFDKRKLRPRTTVENAYGRVWTHHSLYKRWYQHRSWLYQPVGKDSGFICIRPWRQWRHTTINQHK